MTNIAFIWIEEININHYYYSVDFPLNAVGCFCLPLTVNSRLFRYFWPVPFADHRVDAKIVRLNRTEANLSQRLFLIYLKLKKKKMILLKFFTSWALLFLYPFHFRAPCSIPQNPYYSLSHKSLARGIHWRNPRVGMKRRSTMDL